MFQPKQPQMGSASPAPMQQPQPASGQPPQPAPQPGASPGSPQPVANIGFNQDVQNILLTRIQKMPPQYQKILDSVLTPQTIPAFTMLLPELKPLFDAIMQSQQQGPIGQQQAPAGGQPPVPAGGAGALGGGGQPPVQAGGPSAAQPGGQPGQGSGDDDDTDNPLVQSPASNGLIG